jgi:hypothetical protein
MTKAERKFNLTLIDLLTVIVSDIEPCSGHGELARSTLKRVKQRFTELDKESAQQQDLEYLLRSEAGERNEG